MEFITIYFDPTFDLDSIDICMLKELFSIEIALGCGPYLNAYTIDRSIVDSLADELGRENINEIAY